MIAFDPLMNEVRDFNLHAGDVFEAGNEVFLVTLSGDLSLVVVDELECVCPGGFLVFGCSPPPIAAVFSVASCWCASFCLLLRW